VEIVNVKISVNMIKNKELIKDIPNEDFECNPNGDCWCKEEEWKVHIPKTHERCFSPRELKNILSTLRECEDKCEYDK
jgi:hypothetical protein